VNNKAQLEQKSTTKNFIFAMADFFEEDITTVRVKVGGRTFSVAPKLLRDFDHFSKYLDRSKQWDEENRTVSLAGVDPDIFSELFCIVNVRHACTTRPKRLIDLTTAKDLFELAQTLGASCEIQARLIECLYGECLSDIPFASLTDSEKKDIIAFHFEATCVLIECHEVIESGQVFIDGFKKHIHAFDIRFKETTLCKKLTSSNQAPNQCVFSVFNTGMLTVSEMLLMVRQMISKGVISNETMASVTQMILLSYQHYPCDANMLVKSRKELLEVLGYTFDTNESIFSVAELLHTCRSDASKMRLSMARLHRVTEFQPVNKPQPSIEPEVSTTSTVVMPIGMRSLFSKKKQKVLTLTYLRG
jgi:hypothetical protein